MYILISIISFYIRQFVLPNPFAALGDNAWLINLVASGLIGSIAYFIVGMFYTRGELPAAFGSFLYLVVFSILSAEIGIALLAYPHIWLVGIIGGFLVFIDFKTVCFLRKNIV